MTNYLYNGVRLPDINAVWTDKETYPYAFICETTAGGAYYVQLSAKQKTIGGSYLITASMPKYLCVDGAWESIANVTQYASGTAVWSNSDIYYADDYSDKTLAGTLYLAASEPVPVLDITIPRWVDRDSYIAGFALGLAGMAYPYSAPTPVAYLYNGIRLPALPEWDRKKYPYVYIDCNTGGDGRYRAWFLSEKMHSGAFGIKTYPEGTICMFFRLVDGVWEFEETDSEGGWPSIDVPLDPIWTNYDYLDYNPYSDEPDGTVLLAASTPVPVYE